MYLFWGGGLKEVLIFFGTFLVGSWLFVVTPSYSFQKNLHQNKQYLWCSFASKWQSKHLKASPILKPRNITHRWPSTKPDNRSARHRIPLRSAWTWTDATLQDFPNNISGFYCFYPMENGNILEKHPKKTHLFETPGSSKSWKLRNLCYQNYLLSFLNFWNFSKWMMYQWTRMILGVPNE